MTRSAVYKWEHGLSFPSADKLSALAKILHCDVEELYDRRPPGQDSA